MTDSPSSGTRQSGPILTSRLASAITPSRPTWFWRHWLAAGCVELLIGRQGDGKTTWTASLAAHLTTGDPWPGETARRNPVQVGLLSGEEAAGRIVARLTAAGADLGRVRVLSHVEDGSTRRPWRLPGHASVLEQRITEDDLSVVVIDGLGYMVDGDAHKYADIGAALSGLTGVADRTRATILGVTHLPKGASDPVTSAIGSTAWTAIPRITMVLGQEPDDQSRRVVRVAKSNYEKPPHGWAFTIVGDDKYEVGRAVDLARSDTPADALTAVREPGKTGAQAKARHWLEEALVGGPIDSDELARAAHRNGLSAATLKRARSDLGTISRRVLDPETARVDRWTVALPADKSSGSSPVVQPPFEPLDPLGSTRTFAAESAPEAQVSEVEPLESDERPSSSAAPKRRENLSEFESDFADAWEYYPRKTGRQAALRAYAARRRAGVPADNLLAAAEHYALSVAGREQQFVKLGATFYGPDEHFNDFLEPDESRPYPTKWGTHYPEPPPYIEL